MTFSGLAQNSHVKQVERSLSCQRCQAPPYLCNLFHDRFSVSGRSTRNKSQLNLPKCRLSTGQRSFTFCGAKEYNLLPEYIWATNNILMYNLFSIPYYPCKYFYLQYMYIFPLLCNFFLMHIFYYCILRRNSPVQRSRNKVYLHLHTNSPPVT